MAATLDLQSRYPGSCTSSVVDFRIPGLPEVHFCAWGTGHGSVAVACTQVCVCVMWVGVKGTWQQRNCWESSVCSRQVR